MTIKDVVGFILTCSSEERQDILSAIRERDSRQNYEKALIFAVGDKVTFQGKFKRIETGVVEKVNRTALIVKTDKQRWRVSASALTKV